MKYIFDIGGMSTKWAIYNNEEKLAHGVEQYPNFTDSEGIKKIVKQVITANINQFEVTAVGISSPGIINPKTGEIKGLAAIGDYHLVNWKKELTQWTNQVYVENDANCAALAELKFGNAKNINHALIFVIGTGIGGSVIINNQLFHGSNLQAGEFGCNLERFENDQYLNSSTQCSTNALMNFYEKLTNKRLSGEEIFKSYATDKNAQAAIKQMVFNLAKLIMNSGFLLDPELVLIGGAISKNTLFMDLLTQELDRLYLATQLSRQYKIKPCYYYNDANLIGALALIEETK